MKKRIILMSILFALSIISFVTWKFRLKVHRYLLKVGYKKIILVVDSNPDLENRFISRLVKNVMIPKEFHLQAHVIFKEFFKEILFTIIGENNVHN